MGEYRQTTGEKPPATRGERRRTRNRAVVFAVISVAALLLTGGTIKVVRRVPASGYVTTAEYAEVRSPLAGGVAEIVRGSGEWVQSGEVLLRLDDAIERALLAEAESELERSSAELAFKEAELAERQRERANQIATAKMTLDHARRRLEITSRLSEKGLASARDEMEDNFKLELAEAEHARLSQTDFSLAERQLQILRQARQSRREAVARATANLEARKIRAPAAGRLFRHTFYPGEVVRPDMVLYEVFGGDGYVLRLRVPERYATDVIEGQRVRARLRTMRGLQRRRWLRGKVIELRDAIQSEGNQTYRVVYCAFDPGSLSPPPGTSADVQITVGKSPLWQAVLGL